MGHHLRKTEGGTSRPRLPVMFDMLKLPARLLVQRSPAAASSRPRLQFPFETLKFAFLFTQETLLVRSGDALAQVLDPHGNTS